MVAKRSQVATDIYTDYTSRNTTQIALDLCFTNGFNEKC